MSSKNNFISVPYAKAMYGEKEIVAVNEVLRSTTQMGKHTREFEQKIATLFAKKHGIMVNSGSSALLLAMKIANLPKGSEVITPALTFSTTVSSLVHNDLVPAFVDVKRNNYCIDVDKIFEMITPNTKAILAPNLLGNIADWEKIALIAHEHNLLVIEDSADMLGGTLNDQSSSINTDISICSFYGSHIINCAGNGGILCVNSQEHANHAKLLRSWGRSSSLYDEKSEAIENRFNVEVDGVPYDAKFVFEELGYNLEPAELGAAFGVVQLEDLETNIDCRIKNFNRQTDFFKQYEEWFELPQQTPATRTGWMQYPLIVRDDAPFKRRELQIFLEKRNIQTRVVFTGNITRQPGFKNIEMRKSSQGYPEADYVMRGGVLFGCYQAMTDEMFAHFHESFQKFAEQF